MRTSANVVRTTSQVKIMKLNPIVATGSKVLARPIRTDLPGNTENMATTIETPIIV